MASGSKVAASAPSAFSDHTLLPRPHRRRDHFFARDAPPEASRNRYDAKHELVKTSFFGAAVRRHRLEGV
jgi:hypothetical protein